MASERSEGEMIEEYFNENYCPYGGHARDGSECNYCKWKILPEMEKLRAFWDKYTKAFDALDRIATKECYCEADISGEFSCGCSQDMAEIAKNTLSMMRKL